MNQVQSSINPGTGGERLGLISGIIAVAIYILSLVIFIGWIVPVMPPIDAPAEQFAAVMAQQSGNVIYRLYGFFAALRMPFLILFSGGLYSALRRAEGGSGGLSISVFGAGVAMALALPLVAMIEDHLMLGFAAAGLDPRLVKALDGMVPLTIAMLGFLQALIAAGSAAVLGQRRLVAGWIGIAGYLVAALSLAGTATTILGAGFFPVAMLASLLFYLWMLALSAALLRSLGRPVRTPIPSSTVPAA